MSFFFKTPPSIPSSSPALTIFNAAFQLRNLGSFKNRVIPDEPLRPLLTDSLETTEAVYFADIMSQRRSDFAVRSGAVVVHSTGIETRIPLLFNCRSFSLDLCLSMIASRELMTFY